MKGLRDTVLHLIELFEFGKFRIEAYQNDYGTTDYIAFYQKQPTNPGNPSELSYDGIEFKLDGESLFVELTSKECKAINKAFDKAITDYIWVNSEGIGLDYIQAFLQD